MNNTRKHGINTTQSSFYSDFFRCGRTIHFFIGFLISLFLISIYFSESWAHLEVFGLELDTPRCKISIYFYENHPLYTFKSHKGNMENCEQFRIC